MAGRVRIGISGWTYKPWRGDFYPAKLSHKQGLRFAASLFPSIEINGTFYSLQRPSSFATWVRETPEDFVFSVKGSRFITHMLKLNRVEQPLANLYASGLLRLGAKLGPMLWQFPARFVYNAATHALLETFFQLLPHNTDAAVALARRHDSRMEGRDWVVYGSGEDESALPSRPLRHAIEIRHAAFVCDGFIDLLRQYNVALVCADTVEWPLLMDVTADFVYCRLHGSEVLYTSGYNAGALDTWAARAATWARGGEVTDGTLACTRRGPQCHARDVYIYFDNDAKVFAPRDAQTLIEKVTRLLEE